LEVIYDTDDEETQRGAGRGRGLLAASQWSPDSTEVVGRTTLVDTVSMGYGRPRGDATTCPMTYPSTVIEPGNAGRGCGRPVISGAPSWGSSSNAVATVALPSGMNSEDFEMAVDPEMGKVGKGARHKERAMSVDQWNPTKRLTYDVNSLPQRETKSRRQMMSGYATGYRPDCSDDDTSRRHKSEARRSPPNAQHSHGSVTDRRWSTTAQQGSYRRSKEEAKPSHSRPP